MLVAVRASQLTGLPQKHALTVPFLLGGFLLVSPLAAPSVGADLGAPTHLDRAMAAAEASLRAGQFEAAEAQYREALAEGWLLLGAVHGIEGRALEAENALRTASADGNPRALEALALLLIRKGASPDAVTILEALRARDPRGKEARDLLVQALLASGQTERAVKLLEEARAAAPADLEVAFALAHEYLGRKEVDRAARLFATIVAARPVPQTHVLIGSAYRDAGEYSRARAELQIALKQDPRVRRAHYSLGMLILDEKGKAGLDEAIPHFRAEIELAPDDPAANLELGVALVEAQRPAPAVAALELAARSEPPSARALHYLGRAKLGAGRPGEAVAPLRRALELSVEQGGKAQALRATHLQLGRALQAVGQTQEAETHFAEAARLSSQEAEEAREGLARHLSDTAPPPAAAASGPLFESVPLAQIPPTERRALTTRVRGALTRAYLNLGVIEAQRQRFAQAADLLVRAAELDPDFPQVQSSLGVAYFNARQFDKAVGPLTRAVSAQPADRGLKRMLALAWLNLDSYAQAAELLQDDPERERDPSLEFAYGMALVKTDRVLEAERIFSRLLRTHGDSAELSVLLAQAHAQQGDLPAAIAALKRALQLKPDVPEASAALGVIYMRQGRLPEAEEALRAALKTNPSDLPAQQNLATVLDRQEKGEEAVALLRGVVQARPDLSDARYLLGRILVSQGSAAEAVEHLEAAARLAPAEANIRYQLGKAYQRLGKTDLAEKEFEKFRELKAAK
jgi:tetratricopeptide (TPR) repeat protein